MVNRADVENFSRNTILAIDDEQNILDSIKRNLRREEYDILTTTDPVEGLDMFKENKPICTLLDLKMPHMDGYEVLKRMEIDSTHDSHAVIVLTGHGSDEDRDYCYELGANAFLVKPCNFHELASFVRNTVLMKQNQFKLSEKNRELQAILNLIPTGVVVIDPEGMKIVDANPTVAKLLGVETWELIGKTCYDYFCNSTHSCCPQLEQNVNLCNQETVLKTKSGDSIFVLKSLAPIDLNGKKYLIVSIQDITSQKQMENSLRKAKEVAEAANLAKNKFLSNMSHELRTPLNGVIGMAELLAETKVTTEQSEFIKIISKSADSLLNIIDHVLEYSKAEQNKMNFVNSTFNLKTQIESILEYFAETIKKKELDVKFEYSSSLPEYFVSDSRYVRQIMLNLVDNAVKFTFNGSIEIHVELLNDYDNILELKIQVLDTGIGIAPDLQESIFKPFFQVDDSTKRQFGGTGLGLSVTQAIIQKMQGDIRVKSMPGKGAVFTVNLPLAVPDEDMINKCTSVPDERYPIFSGKVLLVEDNILVQKLFTQMLSKQGCDVVTAGTGQEALEKFQQDSFSLILMDCTLPGMNGIEATKQIRLMEAAKEHIPIIAITADAIPGTKEKCIEAGMDDFIVKPIDSDTIKNILFKHCLIND